MKENQTYLEKENYVYPIEKSQTCILDGIEEEQTYLGEDGLLYCKICKEPKEAYYPADSIMGHRKHPRLCRCEREARDQIQHYYEEKEYQEMVYRNKSICFEKKEMYHWTFRTSDDENVVYRTAKKYVANWEQMREKGCLFWGPEGSGKSYLAGCIANALVEKGITVKMTNFHVILSELKYVRDKMEYIKSLISYELLIIDDFTTDLSEKGALENVLSILDYRFQTKRPVIITTRMSLVELKAETDFAKKRVYHRILEMCTPMRMDLITPQMNFPDMDTALSTVSVIE